MGEMADWIVEQMQNAEMDGWDLQSEYDQEDFRPSEKTCKFCGETGLRWQNTESGWRLFHFQNWDNTYELHKCELTKDVNDKAPDDYKQYELDIQGD